MFWTKPKATVPTLSRQFNKDKLMERLVAMAPDDPLLPMLFEMLDAYLLAETAAGASPALDDTEANRFRGRQGMLLDLRADLEAAWRDARTRSLDSKP